MNWIVLIVVVVGFVLVLSVIKEGHCRIIKAIRERPDQLDPSRARKLTDDLRESSEPLAKAIEDNKPISG